MRHGRRVNFTQDMPLEGLGPAAMKAVEAVQMEDDVQRLWPQLRQTCLQVDEVLDPLNQRYFRLALDALSLAWRQDAPAALRSQMTQLVVDLDARKGRSLQHSIQLSRTTAELPEVPRSYDDVLRMPMVERLLLQGWMADQASQDAGHWNTTYLGRVLQHGDDLKSLRILNAGDPLAPGMLPQQTTLGQTLCRRSQELGDRLGRVDSFDLALQEGEDLDQARRAGLVTRYGEEVVPRELTFTRADGRALPWAAETFDGAVSGGMLDHVLGADRALAELARVVKKGGRIYVSGHHLGAGLQQAERWVYAIGEDNHYDVGQGRTTAVDPSEVKRWAADLGLQLTYEMRRPHSWVHGYQRVSA